MKKIIVLLGLLSVLTSCNLKVIKVSEEEKRQEKEIEEQLRLESFVNMKIGEEVIFPRNWKNCNTRIIRIYGGWIIRYDSGYDYPSLFIPYDDFMKEYKK